jgi:hypothetical protein
MTDSRDQDSPGYDEVQRFSMQLSSPPHHELSKTTSGHMPVTSDEGPGKSRPLSSPKKVTVSVEKCTPPTRQAFIELVIVGLRDLISPVPVIPLLAPFIDIRVDDPQGTSYAVSTAPSRRPDPCNPNYLQRLLIPVMLPENALFAPTVQVS